MSYIDYPSFCISASGYRENPERGSTLHRAEDGTPWVVNLWPETRYTFEIVHPALSAEEQLELEQFYDQHIGDEVGWDNPRRQERWIVRMVGPPRLTGMRSGLRGDVEMTLVGYRGTAPTYSVPPVVSGLHQIGQVISVSQGTWQSEYPMQFEYQWLRNGEPIAGATDQNYTLVDDDLFNMISVRVTASSLGGSTSVETEPVRARLDSVVSWLYSDMAETIFVDTSGNTPATWGDPAGLVKDSSGNGNDFTQPTVTARPILGRVPRGGRRNLYTRSQPDINNPQWSALREGEGSIVTRIGREPGPNGIDGIRYQFERPASGHAIVGGGLLGEDLRLAGDYTHSLWAKSGDGETYTITFYSESKSGLTFEVGPEWQRLVIPSVREEGVTRYRGIGLNNHTSAYNIFADIIIADGQYEIGEEATAFQQVIAPYDVTEEGVPEVHYLDFDLTDDNLTTTLPAIENGTVVIAGTNGIWIDDDYNFDGGTFSIGPTSYTNGLEGILEVIGDPIAEGFLVINRQLSQLERERVIEELKERGAPGVFELGPELLVNGDFSDGFDGWSILGSEPERWSVSDGVATIAVGTGTSSHLRQINVTEGGLPHLITIDIVSSNGVGLLRAGGGTDNQRTFQLTDHPVGEITTVFVSGGFQPNILQVFADAGTQASMSRISFRQLELVP